MTKKYPYYEIGRTVFLAAIMISSMVAMSVSFAGAATAQQSSDAVRDVPTDANQGDVVTATVEVTPNEDISSITVDEAFSPSFANAGGAEISIEGQSFTDFIINELDAEGATLFSDAGSGNTLAESGQTITVTYDIVLPDSNGDYEITGSVSLTNTNNETTTQDLGTSTITVGQTGSADFQIIDVTPPNPTVNPEQEFDVTVNVTNQGNILDTQHIKLFIDGNQKGDWKVNLDVDENTTVSFLIDASTLQPGEYTYSIASENDSAEGDLTVLQPATFEVSNLDPVDATVTQGNNLTVSANVTNSGDLHGEKNISLSVKNESGAVTELGMQTVNLAAGYTATLTFKTEDVQLNAGNYSHTVSTEDDSTDGNLTIEEADDGPILEDYQQIGDGPDNKVNIKGLRAAIEDFINGLIEISLFRKVINDFIK